MYSTLLRSQAGKNVTTTTTVTGEELSEEVSFKTNSEARETRAATDREQKGEHSRFNWQRSRISSGIYSSLSLPSPQSSDGLVVWCSRFVQHRSRSSSGSSSSSSSSSVITVPINS